MDGSCCLDSDVTVFGVERFAEVANFIKDHRFPARDHNVRSCPFGGCVHDSVDVPRVPLGLPGSVTGIAKPAPEVATARSYEDAGGACKFAFPLDAVKNFRDPDHAGLKFASLEQSICRPVGKMHCYSSAESSEYTKTNSTRIQFDRYP